MDKKAKTAYTLTSLLVSNLVPVIGVFYFDWEISTLLTVYWTESGVVGFYNILKMLKTKPEMGSIKKLPDSLNNILLKLKKGSKVFSILFFIMHFGFFMLVHWMMLTNFFSEMTGFTGFNFNGTSITLLGLFISHGVSFYNNYIDGEEYKDKILSEVMKAPYSRIVVMHIVIIFSGLLAKYLGSYGLATLLLMISLKIIFDVYGYFREHG